MIYRDQALRSTHFSLILPSPAAIAQAKRQLNRFFENLPVSERVRARLPLAASFARSAGK